MGPLAILMALLLLGGAGAGIALLAVGSPSPFAGLAWMAGGLASFALFFRAIEPLATAAHVLAVREARTSARLLALLFGASPALAIVAYQLWAARALGGGGELLNVLWLLATATAPATLLALVVGRSRQTLWGIRAYAGHLSAWIMVAGAALGLAPSATAALMLLSHWLPTTVGYLEALADPRMLRAVRM